MERRRIGFTAASQATIDVVSEAMKRAQPGLYPERRNAFARFVDWLLRRAAPPRHEKPWPLAYWFLFIYAIDVFMALHDARYWSNLADLGFGLWIGAVVARRHYEKR